MEKQVIIGSQNPVKLQCVKDSFQLLFGQVTFSFKGCETVSGVSDQPMTDEETYMGALNRARFVRAAFPMADFCVGIEGGISDDGKVMEAFAWVVIIGASNQSRARTATFLLPEKVASLVRGGIELGVADDMVFGRSNSKQKDGAVGLLTNGAITRTAYYSHAVTLALIPFLKEEVFGPVQLP